MVALPDHGACTAPRRQPTQGQEPPGDEATFGGSLMEQPPPNPSSTCRAALHFCSIIPVIVIMQPPERGPWCPPCWWRSWQARSSNSAALLHSSSRRDYAALIDNNGKWQNRWETREGCT
ncbi:hypothetical protein NQZ68_020561 [Dissostichus eleginoides]|nr:hypothetical protein NQZ68_020561 [Dissostichus eleginoides]